MEIGLAVGGAFLSSALNVLFDRLAPNGDLLNMFRKHTDDVQLFEKLGDILLGLQIVLSDAENKKSSNQFVNQWLNKLQSAVDGAENLIEQLNYEALRLKVEGQLQNLAETSNQQVSDDFFLNIKKKLEDTIKKLEVLEKQIGRLGLKEHFVSTKQETRTPSTSLVDDAGIFGRQNEIENLIGRLLSMDTKGKNLAVVPIVGMGGLGKTTLAKAVYNDERVQKHFGLKAWFCVSEAYDAFRITKGLLQEIGKFDSKDVHNNLNQLQVKLKESLKGKKFLIVLDDVWNNNYNKWVELRNVFVQGDIGSKIIVTTRKETVASMMGGKKISMDKLSTKASWSLFKRHAFENMDLMGHPELEEVGKQIADKCKGLPLALKTLAGMLRSKSEVEEWKRILRSEIWELPDNDILPALMLSYNDLPVHLKRCFSYCAIFPKDYPFRKEQVIHLWIANGIVPKYDEIIQDSGNQYFLELRSRSLFEMVPNPSKRNIEELFLMHDLVNDLAKIASSKLCIRLEESKGSDMLEKSRHLSYSMGEGGEFEKLTPLYKLEQLKTFLPTIIDVNYCYHHLSKRVLHNVLPRLTSLRALSLSHYKIKELPIDLFIKLKLLRFLDISQTEIKRLPDSICVLYNLETLLLSSCGYLEELPLQMEKLINLRHLDISNTWRLKMPLHLSKLKSLQVQVGAKFLLGGLRMEDLGEAQNLYGSVSVLELQNVVDRREALKAKMKKKNHVEQLSLKWSESSSADNSQTERDILDELHPHSNIKQLKITGYRGTIFPDWLADPLFLKLVQLSIGNCMNCYSLPALGQLPCLKFLSIRGMHGITEVTEEFYGSWSSKKPFNCLEELEFEDMAEWKQWHVLGNREFPTLEKLKIENCPEVSLETPIQLSSLKMFQVIGCPKVFDDAQVFRSQLEGMKEMEELFIHDCNSVTSFPFSILPTTLKRIRISDCQKLKLDPLVGEMSLFLEELFIRDCNSVTSFPFSILPTTLKTISIIGCPKLKLDPLVGEMSMFLKELRVVGSDCIDDISPELLPRARKLWVQDCHNLTRVLIPTATESLIIWGYENVEILSVACGGTQMTTLSIHGCKKLKCLPERMQELLPSLKHLDLENCPEIESFPEGGLPFNLQLLAINECKKLVNGRKEWRLHRLPCLTKLWISYDGSDEEIVGGENWELPSSIQTLSIYNLKTLSSQHLKNLTSLQHLHIVGNLAQIESMMEQGQFFSSFSHLTSLQTLHIRKFPNLQSLSKSALPSSLSQLRISRCPNLQSLSESALPSSLSQLEIKNCPNLQSLPLKGMPSSLSNLHIYKCPLLRPLLEFDKGEYWPNIAQIPIILIDQEYL